MCRPGSAWGQPRILGWSHIFFLKYGAIQKGEIWLSRVGISHFTGEVRRKTPALKRRVLLLYEGEY